MTKALLKDDKTKFYALKVAFRNTFRDSQMYLTSSEGCAFNIDYLLPKNKKEKCVIRIEQGDIYTQDQIQQKVEEVKTAELQEIFQI